MRAHFSLQLSIYISILISFTSCSESTTIRVEAEPKSDSNVSGTITFSEMNEVVVMKATFSGLTPGLHAIHLHELADCSSADGKSTGGHWNPTFEPHGAWGSEIGYHKNIFLFVFFSFLSRFLRFFLVSYFVFKYGDATKNIIGKYINVISVILITILIIYVLKFL